MRLFLAGYKLLFAALSIGAIASAISKQQSNGTFVASNFFAQFTIQTNILVSAVLIFSALFVLARKTSKTLEWLRGASTLYMVTTTLIFSIIIAGLDFNRLSELSWENRVLHFIVPAGVFIDWLLDKPKQVIEFRKAALWVLYPITYVIYTLIRGNATGWYPYSFLDPRINGYPKITAVTIGIMVSMLALTWLLLRFRPNKAHTS